MVNENNKIYRTFENKRRKMKTIICIEFLKIKEEQEQLEDSL